MTQHARAHHWRQGQGHHRRDQNGHRQGDGKLTEQTPDDIPHKQQRDQHRNQREGEGDNGEADLARPFQRRRQRLFPFFDIAGDVFDHHDGVIHHKAGGDGQGHQRQVVDREVEEHHHREGAHQREWHRHGGNNGRRNVAQEQVDDHHHQRNRQHQLKLGIADRGANVGGAIRQHLDADRFRQAVDKRWQHGANAVGGINDIRPRLALHVHHNRLLLVGPRPEPAVFCPLLDGGDIP